MCDSAVCIVYCPYRLYDQYSFQVIPALGEVVAGDRDSYQYLVESIREFPNQVTTLCTDVSNGLSARPSFSIPRWPILRPGTMTSWDAPVSSGLQKD